MTAPPSPLAVRPAPLIFADRNLVLGWSQKSACSHVVVWFYIQEGLLRAANYYHGWPHNFRTDVYYGTERYRRRAADLTASGGRGWTLLKVTRDPAKRMVSAFRHACRHDFLHEELKRKLGLDAARDGLSLDDLDRYLTGESLMVPSAVDVHLCSQRHPVWDLGFDRTITLNLDQTPLDPGLNAVERDLDLPVTEFSRYPKFDQLRQSHYAAEGEFAGPGPIEAHRFTRAETAAFPKKQLEASPKVAEMARRLHAADYGHVELGDTAGRLFRPA